MYIHLCIKPTYLHMYVINYVRHSAEDAFKSDVNNSINETKIRRNLIYRSLKMKYS